MDPRLLSAIELAAHTTGQIQRPGEPDSDFHLRVVQEMRVQFVTRVKDQCAAIPQQALSDRAAGMVMLADALHSSVALSLKLHIKALCETLQDKLVRQSLQGTTVPTSTLTAYVLGFLFDESLQKVVLIVKNRPQWQAGMLNGVGGKIETDESPEDAMRREFQEETGVDVATWQEFAFLGDGQYFALHVFAAKGAVNAVKTSTDEQVVVVPAIQSLAGTEVGGSGAMVENLAWLIPLAMDVLTDKRPSYVRAFYPAV